MAVGTIIDDGGGRILLVRRAIEPGYGKWVFPGGYVDRGEPVVAAAVREAREESGLNVALHSLVDIYSYAGRTPIIVVYAASRVSGDLQVDEEGLERAGSPPTRSPGTNWPSRARSKVFVTISPAGCTD